MGLTHLKADRLPSVITYKVDLTHLKVWRLSSVITDLMGLTHLKAINHISTFNDEIGSLKIWKSPPCILVNKGSAHHLTRGITPKKIFLFIFSRNLFNCIPIST